MDCFENFSLIVELTTIHSVVALVATEGYFLNQFNVNNAFLHEDLNEKVYMSIPLDFFFSISKIY